MVPEEDLVSIYLQLRKERTFYISDAGRNQVV